MTLHELAHQIYTLPYNMPCYINDVKRTSESDVRQLIKHWLMVDYKTEYPTAKMICQIALPDGRWMIKMIRNGSEYDLYVPETREQEKHLYAELGIKVTE